MKVQARIESEVFDRRYGKSVVHNTGYIDSNKIAQELLQLNMGCIRIHTEEGMLPIPVNTIKSITYIIKGKEHHIDCDIFHQKTFDKNKGMIIDICNVKQPQSTITRSKNRGTGQRCTYPDKIYQERKSWYDENVLTK